jgi:hypothetical protein
MNRNKRRQAQRNNEVFSKAVNKLTPLQVKVIDRLADQKAAAKVEYISTVINDCLYSALRENKVGEERAANIINRCEELINEHSDSPKRSV